jgi:hypothetical protein
MVAAAEAAGPVVVVGEGGTSPLALALLPLSQM